MAKIRHREGPLEKKWRSYTGTGIAAQKGKNALALREAIGGGEFAIVKLYGGLWTSSPVKVLEVLKTGSLKKAVFRFRAVVKKLDFKMQPLRQATLAV